MRRMALNSTPRTPMPWKIKLKCHKTLLPTLCCTLLRAHISSEGDDNGQSVAAAPGGAGLFIISTLLTDQLFSILLPLLVHRSSFSFYLSIGILGYVSHIQCVVSISSVMLEGPQPTIMNAAVSAGSGGWAMGLTTIWGGHERSKYATTPYISLPSYRTCICLLQLRFFQHFPIIQSDKRAAQHILSLLSLY